MDMSLRLIFRRATQLAGEVSTAHFDAVCHRIPSQDHPHVCADFRDDESTGEAPSGGETDYAQHRNLFVRGIHYCSLCDALGEDSLTKPSDEPVIDHQWALTEIIRANPIGSISMITAWLANTRPCPISDRAPPTAQPEFTREDSLATVASRRDLSVAPEFQSYRPRVTTTPRASDWRRDDLQAWLYREEGFGRGPGRPRGSTSRSGGIARGRPSTTGNSGVGVLQSVNVKQGRKVWTSGSALWILVRGKGSLGMRRFDGI